MSKGADLKDKIRKLLALAKSPEEHEAKAALLKARQLMAEHKLTEEELRSQAATWQVRRGNRSGRTAQQFVSDLLSRIPDPGREAQDPTKTTEG